MLNKIIAFIRNEPSAIVAVVQTAVGLVVALGFHLTTAEVAGIVSFTTALLAVVPAVLARPVGISAVTAAVSAGATLLIAFGVPHVEPGAVAAINAVIVSVAALVLRGQVETVVALKAKAKQDAVPVK